MSAIRSAESLSGHLVLTDRPLHTAPTIVRQETLLASLPSDALETSHLFTADENGRIVGVVATSEIHQRLQTANECERMRWAEMPISYLAKITFPSVEPATFPKLGRETPCQVVFDRGALLSIIANDDLFVSWRCLKGAINGAIADPLTGLMNRLAYERRLHEEWERACRMDFSIAVIMVDLDHFKDINDQYGHDRGDEVLRRVASSLELSLRSYDVLARYGGDEFVALCVGCRPGEISIPISRILSNLNTEASREGPDGMHISGSVGGAVRHDGFAASEPADLFVAADRCLYLAKEVRGRGCWTELGAAYEPGQTSYGTFPEATGVFEMCPAPEAVLS